MRLTKLINLPSQMSHGQEVNNTPNGGNASACTDDIHDRWTKQPTLESCD